MYLPVTVTAVIVTVVAPAPATVAVSEYDCPPCTFVIVTADVLVAATPTDNTRTVRSDALAALADVTVAVSDLRTPILTDVAAVPAIVPPDTSVTLYSVAAEIAAPTTLATNVFVELALTIVTVTVDVPPTGPEDATARTVYR